jgi:hypothetical protein
MRKGDLKRGLTVVELLVASVSAAILALTAGSMLFYGYTSWHNNSQAVELQRDGTFVLDMVGRRIRAASSADVTVGPGQLTIATQSFHASGSDLVYDPDTGVLGDEQVLVDERLVSFVPVHLTNIGVRVDVSLAEGDERVALSATAAFRQ